MDIRCPKCAEPWDMDTLHEIGEELGISYSEASQRFRREGCGAVPGVRPCAPVDSPLADASALLMDLLGDDMDGVASMLDDFERGY